MNEGSVLNGSDFCYFLLLYITSWLIDISKTEKIVKTKFKNCRKTAWRKQTVCSLLCD